MIASCHLTDRFACHIQHGVAMTGDSLIHQFDTHQFLSRTFGLLLGQCLLTNKLGLIQLDEHAQASHDRRDILREFVAIKWQAHLETQGIATTQSTSLNTCCNQLVPALTDIVVVGINLKAILARITCTRDDNIANSLTSIEYQFSTRQAQYRFNDMLALRSLNSYLTIEVGTVLQVDIKALGILLHPGPVLIDVSGIDDQEEIVLAHLIHQQIVNRTTILVAHHTIVDLAHRSTSDIVGKNVLHITLGIRTFYGYLAHVRNIKQAHMLANGRMLGSNTSHLIKQGHVKTTKRYHGGTKL